MSPSDLASPASPLHHTKGLFGDAGTRTPDRQHDNASTLHGVPPPNYDSAEATRVSTPVPYDRQSDEKTLNEKGEFSFSIASPSSLTQDLDDYPDGGLRAWLVVAGGVCNVMATFGYVSAWGTFQGYYSKYILTDTSPSSIAWIGSLQYSLIFFPSLFTGRVFDLGYYKGPQTAASVLLVVATFLTAHCTKYWHFLLCQGVGVGIACGIVFGPTISVVAHWFKRRRGVAVSIPSVGSSIGGTIFPILFRRLVGRIGFPWTMRVIGFILLVLLIIPIFTMRRRLPPSKSQTSVINLKPFAEPALFLYTTAGFLCFLGLWTMLTYINPSAVHIGMPEDLSVYLVAIANAASTFSRIGSGVLADKIGAVSMMIPMTSLAGAITIIWPFVTSKGGLIFTSTLYGIGSGTFISLCFVPAIAFGPMDSVGGRTGTLMTLMAFGGLAGPPISGAISTATNGYKAVGIYAGCCILGSVMIMTFARYCRLGGWKGKF